MNTKIVEAFDGTRKEIRDWIVKIFLEEEPGTGKGNDSSKHTYIGEQLNNGSHILLKRPANLNKGMDFTIHVENLRFREKGFIDMPSHENIIDDLLIKNKSDAIEYEKVKILISKLFKCEYVSQQEYLNINFNVGHPIEAILKAIKWLFIEQDVTYWNWSGRNMFYTTLHNKGLC